METNEVKKPVVVPLFFDNYLAVVKNSAGSALFRNWYCLVDGERNDVVKDGKFSCALYVTALLKMFGLVDEIQITVHRAIAELERSGWKPTDRPTAGDIVVWDAQKAMESQWGNTSGLAKHIGFCIDDGKAISYRHETASAQIDDVAYRAVLGYFHHEKLEQ